MSESSGHGVGIIGTWCPCRCDVVLEPSGRSVGAIGTWCPCRCDVVPVSSGRSVGVFRRRCVGVGVGVVGTWCRRLWEVVNGGYVDKEVDTNDAPDALKEKRPHRGHSRVAVR